MINRSRLLICVISIVMVFSITPIIAFATDSAAEGEQTFTESEAENEITNDDYQANSHEEVLGVKEVNNAVTNVTASENTIMWGDYLVITIDYTAQKEVTEAYISSKNTDTNKTFNLSCDISPNVVNRVPFYSSSYDQETGVGNIVIKKQINAWEGYLGEFQINNVRLEYYSGRWVRINYAPSDVSFSIESSFDNVAFYKDFYETDLIEAINNLQEGEIGVIKCGDDNVLFHNGGALIKKEYLDAISGRDVSLLFPNGMHHFVRADGIDITGETKDVVMQYGMSFSSGGEEDEFNYTFSITCPANGQLPGKMKFMYDMPNILSFLEQSIDEQMDNVTPQQILDEMKLYYLQSGQLILEDNAMTNDDNWLILTLDHNSTFVASTSSADELVSFRYSINKRKFTYNGKVQKPTIKIISGACSKKYGNKNSKAVGKYKVLLTNTDPEEGYGQKEVIYTIIPKGTKLSSLSGKKKTIVVKWKKQSAKMNKTRISGYQVRYSSSSSMSDNTIKTIKGYKKTKTSVKGLEAKKKYYVQVRTYKNVNGTTLYSNWSSKKSVKTK